MQRKEESDFIIWPRHARSILAANGTGYCLDGMEKFADRYGFDFKDFIKNGISISKLEATNDAMAQLVIEKAREEWAVAEAVERKDRELL